MHVVFMNSDSLKHFMDAQLDRLRCTFSSRTFVEARSDLQETLGLIQELQTLAPRRYGGSSVGADAAGSGWQFRAIFEWIIPRVAWLVQRMTEAGDVDRHLALNSRKKVVYLTDNAVVKRILQEWMIEDDDVLATPGQFDIETDDFYFRWSEPLREFVISDMALQGDLRLSGEQFHRVSMKCFSMMLDCIEYVASDYLDEEEHRHYIEESEKAWFVLEWLCKGKGKRSVHCRCNYLVS